MAVAALFYADYVENTTATLDLIAPGEATMRHRFQTVTEGGLPYLVAELDGYIVGYCYASLFRPRAGYQCTVEDSIYVRSDCRGYGVGRMLLSELITRCQAHGTHSMIACVIGENPASTALHASLGFVETGPIFEAGRKFGKWLSISFMQRLLQPQPATDEESSVRAPR
jgi:phosphinothricin acetyltransferase